MNKPTVLETINLKELIARCEAYDYDLIKAGIHARFVQSNTRALGPIQRVTPGYSVYTKELTTRSEQELWWCCHGGHQIEILDKEQPLVRQTSNF